MCACVRACVRACVCVKNECVDNTMQYTSGCHDLA